MEGASPQGLGVAGALAKFIEACWRGLGLKLGMWTLGSFWK
jgi:hypothetical protein